MNEERTGTRLRQQVEHEKGGGFGLEFHYILQIMV